MVLDWMLPEKKIGCISPNPITDSGPYEFYRLAPPRVLMRYVAVDLRELTAEDVERVYAPIDRLVRQLAARGIDLVVQGGVPLPVAIGRVAHERLLARMAEVAGAPATSSLDCVIEGLRALGLKRIVVANKWNDDLNRRLAEEFFAPAGIQVVGFSTQPMPLSDIRSIPTEGNAQLACELGRAGLTEYPAADGLYIGGGSWLSSGVVAVLEQEFGRPVVSNSVAAVWSLCRRVGMWHPREGFGRLIATP